MRLLALVVALCSLALPAYANNRGVLELSFTPTDRAQVAVWVERDDGKMFATLALTHAVSVAGIGNRPGASQMNSGFRWPYGRREGVLPVWAHRRAASPDAKMWKRVIFQNRSSEGFASRTSNDMSRDDYYCLSFDRETTDRDALDAVTCASVFSSDKGRFITKSDVNGGYAEPWEDEKQAGSMRGLDLWSLYPPRRDIARCTAPGCYDHPDVALFKKHAVDVMPELDAVTRATPAGERLATWRFSVPNAWDAGHEYTLYIEINTEGDYNDDFGPSVMRTPKNPAAKWDQWATSYGYPYRGQPSVVYAMNFRIDAPNEASAEVPAGYGETQGLDGELRAMSNVITNDPGSRPGSGADRLRMANGVRTSLRFAQIDPCSLDDPPPQCGMACSDNPDICEMLVCDDDGTCKSECAAADPPPAVEDLETREHPDRIRAHMWAELSFVVPKVEGKIGGFDINVRSRGGEWQQAFTHDPSEDLLPVALDACADPKDPTRNRCPELEAGDELTFDLTGLRQDTDYEVSVRVRDAKCNRTGAEATSAFRTPSRVFTTVSPCFVATATYGSPLATQIGVLREFRDRYLATHAPGRALIRVYYSVGPKLAEVVHDNLWLRRVTRAMLDPVVKVLGWWFS